MMKKYFIIALATFSLFLGSVKATSIKTYVNDLQYDSSTLSTSWYTYRAAGNRNIFFDLVFDTEVNNRWNYVSLVLCSSSGFSGGIVPSGYQNYIKGISYNETSYSCPYANSSYDGGKVVIINFMLFNGEGEFSGYFTTYQNGSSSIQLIDFVINDNQFVAAQNYSSYDLIIKNSQIINQNNTIINQGQQTNDKLDDLNSKQDKTNDTLTSEDDDVTSKKCGVVCKLKGIFTGIIELPSKIVNGLIDALKSLFVPTDEQLYEIVNKSKDLSENFGFVGESVNFFIDIFTSLLGMVNANGCIELPAFKMGATSLFDEHTFWEARQTCLADNVILSANIDTIRTITSIVFVSLFLGFASRKFFSILSKESNNNDVTDSVSNTKWI